MNEPCRREIGFRCFAVCCPSLLNVLCSYCVLIYAPISREGREGPALAAQDSMI